MKTTPTGDLGRYSVIGALLVLSALFAGCAPGECDVNTDCESGYRCVYFPDIDMGKGSVCVNDFVSIKAKGVKFNMGIGDFDETKPEHEVTFKNSFRIGINEVTVADYEACVKNGLCPNAPDTKNGCNYAADQIRKKIDYPINCVSWQQAKDYCSKTYAGGRLCSEAEWEFAARRTNSRIYPWNTTQIDCTNANYLVVGSETTCGGEPLGVWSKEGGTTPDGIWNLSGNVSEWVADDWHNNYNAAPADGTAWIASPAAANKPIRGGSYNSDDLDVRTYVRGTAAATAQSPEIGFRCCMDGE